MSADAVGIREARPDDLDAVLPLYEWLFAAPGAPPPGGWDPAAAAPRLAAAIEGEDAAILLADEGGRLVGLCSAYLDLLSVRYGLRCWVEDLAVDPERRSRGIGSRLLAAARRWASERGASHLELDTGEKRVDAQRFYEREGAVARSISYAWRLRA